MAGRIQFSELELDALKETMNIGFGQAAASLAEVINMHVVLTVPKIVTLEPSEVASFVQAEIDDPTSFSIVEQFFLGRFNGTSFLLFPERESEKLINLFDEKPGTDKSAAYLDALERETIVEIGNIIIGACVGKIAEILKDMVSYKPPRFFAGPLGAEMIERQLRSSGGLALVLKTIFCFDKQDVQGFLFLVVGEDTAGWLKGTVDEMLGVMM